MNEILFFVTIILGIVGVTLSHQLFGKVGVFCWIAFAGILANIEVSEAIVMFGVPCTLGNVLYCSNSLAQDTLNELYGRKVSSKAVWIGFFALIACMILSQAASAFVPAPGDTFHTSLDTVFNYNWKVVVASLSAYLLSSTINVRLYDWIAKKTKKIWVRSGCSTWIAQLFDTFAFSALCVLFGVFTKEQFGVNSVWSLIWVLSWVGYLIKIAIASLNIPCLYMIKYFNKKHQPVEI